MNNLDALIATFQSPQPPIFMIDGEPMTWEETVMKLISELRPPLDAKKSEKRSFDMKAYDFCKSCYGKIHPVTAACKRNLAWQLYHEGDVDSASKHLEQIMKSYQLLYGEDSDSSMEIMTDLAMCLELSDVERAKTLLKEVMKQCAEIYGSSHPIWIEAAKCLGSIEVDAGEYAAASITLRECLDASLDFYPYHDESSMWILLNLAISLKEQGKLDEARILVCQGLREFETGSIKCGNMLGKFHNLRDELNPDNATGLN